MHISFFSSQGDYCLSPGGREMGSETGRLPAKSGVVCWVAFAISSPHAFSAFNSVLLTDYIPARRVLTYRMHYLATNYLIPVNGFWALAGFWGIEPQRTGQGRLLPAQVIHVNQQVLVPRSAQAIYLDCQCRWPTALTGPLRSSAKGPQTRTDSWRQPDVTLISPLSAPIATHLPITGRHKGDKQTHKGDTLVPAVQ